MKDLTFILFMLSVIPFLLAFSYFFSRWYDKVEYESKNLHIQENQALIGDIVTANNGKQYKIIEFEPYVNINGYHNAIEENGYILYQNRNSFAFIDKKSIFWEGESDDSNDSR